jgi:hypothetical protein
MFGEKFSCGGVKAQDEEENEKVFPSGIFTVASHQLFLFQHE